MNKTTISASTLAIAAGLAPAKTVQNSGHETSTSHGNGHHSVSSTSITNNITTKRVLNHHSQLIEARDLLDSIVRHGESLQQLEIHSTVSDLFQPETLEDLRKASTAIKSHTDQLEDRFTACPNIQIEQAQQKATSEATAMRQSHQKIVRKKFDIALAPLVLGQTTTAIQTLGQFAEKYRGTIEASQAEAIAKGLAN